MLDENKFWEIIEKNKENPLKLWDEVHDYSLEDMFGFLIILEDVEKRAFSLEDNESYNFMGEILKGDIYNQKCLDEVILRGKDFYDIFINKDINQLIKVLKENPELNNGNITINDMHNIWALRIVEKDSEKYNRLKSLRHLDNSEFLNTENGNLIYDTFKEFIDKCEELGIKDKYKKQIK